MKRIIVVGGGITGLAAAYRLQNLSNKLLMGWEVLLLEAGSRVGGIIQTKSQGDFLLEAGPDCFLTDKPAALELCKELGLEKELLHVQPDARRSFIVRGDQLYPVPEGFYLLGPSRLRPFLSSPLLSWSGKLRALLEIVVPSRSQDDETVGAFVRRRFGRDMLEHLAQPLAAGIYAADPDTLSLRATFPQFAEMERKFGGVILGLKARHLNRGRVSGARYSLFATLRGGMQRLVEKLQEQFPQGRLREDTRVSQIKNVYPGLGKGWQVTLAGGSHIMADGVCLALPAHVAAGIVRHEDKRLADALGGIPYADSATVNVAYAPGSGRGLPTASGFVVPQTEKRFVFACTFVHAKFEGRAPAGSVLLRAFLGGPAQKMVLNKSDYEIEQLVTRDLARLFYFTKPPLFTTVHRYPKAMPQYTVGHIRRIKEVQESLKRLPGLKLAGNWIYGVGLPDCIESGMRAADELFAHLTGG